jgi:uncharacterized protein
MRIEDIMAWAEAKMRWSDESPLECGFRYFHGLRVADIARMLAESRSEEYDQQTLFLGAFLHDVGKAGYRGPDHGPRGAEMICREAMHMIAEKQREGICNAVANHYMRPRSSWLRGREVPELRYETLLVQDADILDHFGVVALWTAIRWSVQEGRNQLETIDRYYGDAAWLEEASQSLNFAESREELAKRIALQETIYDSWRREQAGIMGAKLVTGDE